MFRDSLISRVQNSQAEIRMNTAVTPELIRELEPDLVISAVGGDHSFRRLRVLIMEMLYLPHPCISWELFREIIRLLSGEDLWDVRRLSPLRRMERM